MKVLAISAYSAGGDTVNLGTETCASPGDRYYCCVPPCTGPQYLSDHEEHCISSKDKMTNERCAKDGATMKSIHGSSFYNSCCILTPKKEMVPVVLQWTGKDFLACPDGEKDPRGKFPLRQEV